MPDSDPLRPSMHTPRHIGQAEPLPDPSEMARADAGCGVPVPVLMHAAGWAIARAARRLGPCRTLVLCGPGNNGGDGYVAARLLAQQGWPVQVAAWRPPKPCSVAGDAATQWRGMTVPFAAEEAARAELVIDAVLGAGLDRDIPAEIDAVLAAARRVLAVDVPSGLDGGTGQPRGPVRRAQLTVTFAARKPGHLLLPGRTLCGTVVLADIGMPTGALSGVRTWRNTPALWRLAPPDDDAHKYTRGHVTVLGGAAMTGAARLSAGAARRTGAGMVTIAALGSADVYRTGEPGVIVSEAPVADLLDDARRQVWVCGPGLGIGAAQAVLPVLLQAGRQVVADADALGAFAAQPERLAGCAVLTPHEGEFTKLFGPPGADRLAAARAASSRTGSVVLLKGADTVVAAPDGRAAINDSAPPWLATAGAGDVLSGMVAALLAQRLPPWEAACAAAYLHGRAAVHAGPYMVAEDLLTHLPQALCEHPVRGAAPAL